MTDNVPPPVLASSLTPRTDYQESLPKTVRITSTKFRRILSYSMYALAGVSGAASLFFIYFPEVANGSTIPDRVIAFINALISTASGIFGVSVSAPNIGRTESNG